MEFTIYPIYSSIKKSETNKQKTHNQPTKKTPKKPKIKTEITLLQVTVIGSLKDI